MNVVDQAIQAVGSLNELSRLLGVKPQVVVNWRARGVPAGRVLAIEQATAGRVTRHALRPDLYPLEQAA